MCNGSTESRRRKKSNFTSLTSGPARGVLNTPYCSCRCTSLYISAAVLSVTLLFLCHVNTHISSWICGTGSSGRDVSAGLTVETNTWWSQDKVRNVSLDICRHCQQQTWCSQEFNCVVLQFWTSAPTSTPFRRYCERSVYLLSCRYVSLSL